MPVKKRNARGDAHGWVVENANGKVLFNFDNNLFGNKSNPCYKIFNKGNGNNNACRRHLKSRGASNKNLRNGLKIIRNIRQNEQNRKAGQGNVMANDTHKRLIRWFDKMLIIVTPPPKMTSPIGFVPRVLMTKK